MKSSSGKTIIIAILIAVLAVIQGCSLKTGVETKAPEKNSQTQKAAPKIDQAKAVESDKLFEQGVRFYREYNYQEAITNFDKAIAANPANFKVYTAKGIALCFQGEYKGGMTLIQKTLDMNPGYVPAYYDMAMAYKLQNNYDQSLYWFEKTIQGDPKSTWSYYGISTIYADRGNTAESLKYLKKAIELDQVVKEVAQEQDHFAKMRNLPEFKALVR